MSDLMLFGVLRMPQDLAMADEFSRHQFYDRAQQAADRLEHLQATARAVIAAFEALGQTQSPVMVYQGREVCQQAMLRLKDELISFRKLNHLLLILYFRVG